MNETVHPEQLEYLQMEGTGFSQHRNDTSDVTFIVSYFGETYEIIRPIHHQQMTRSLENLTIDLDKIVSQNGGSLDSTLHHKVITTLQSIGRCVSQGDRHGLEVTCPLARSTRLREQLVNLGLGIYSQYGIQMVPTFFDTYEGYGQIERLFQGGPFLSALGIHSISCNHHSFQSHRCIINLLPEIEGQSPCKPQINIETNTATITRDISAISKALNQNHKE